MILAALALAFLCGCVQPEQKDAEEDKLAELLGMEKLPEGLAYQAWFGVMNLDADDQDLERISAFDSTVSAEPEITTIPVVGVAMQKRLVGETLAAGAEGGFTIGYWFDGDRTRASTGVVLIDVDSELLLLEGFFGGYAAVNLGEAARFYAGAGPLLYAALYDSEVEDYDPVLDETYTDDKTKGAVGAGVYARAGIDLFFAEDCGVGFGLRQVIADLDFGSDVGEIEMEGIQAFLTWTLRF